MTFRRPYTQTDARAALSKLLFWRRDQPDRPLLDQMRELHGVPFTALVVYDTPAASVQMDNPRLKPRTLAEWQRRHGRKAG